MKAIEIKSLNKYYGSFHAIKDLSLTVNEGEVFGFIGPNGAGKSTAIRCALGLLKPSSGGIKIFGHDALKEKTAVRAKIGYLPSEVHYYDNMSSKELLEYSARFYETSVVSKIHELAEYFELDLQKKIADLSFGNKKKCAIIQAVVHQPKLLILDEPTSGLDPLMQNRFFDLMHAENEKGTTIFFSSHILSEVQRMCHRAAIIQNGEIKDVEDIQILLKKQVKQVRAVFEDLPEIVKMPSGIRNRKIDQHKMSFEYVGPANELIEWLNLQNLVDVVIEEPDLESIFMHFYEK